MAVVATATDPSEDPGETCRKSMCSFLAVSHARDPANLLHGDQCMSNSVTML